jgi:Na+(H+)/acetate symporter ActP
MVTNKAARPWEHPGAVRRDREPHRASLMNWLYVACMASSFMFPALVYEAFWPGIRKYAGAAIGGYSAICVLLGTATWIMAKTDLKKMRGNEMDLHGRVPTEHAVTSGVLCLVVGFLFLVVVSADSVVRLLR